MKKRLLSIGLINRTLVINIIGLSLFLLVAILIGNQIGQELINQTLEERLRLTQMIAARVDDYLQNNIQIVEMMIKIDGVDPENWSDRELNEFSRRIREHLGGFTYYVAIFNDKKEIIGAFPGNEELLGFDFSNASCVTSVLNDGKPLITKSFTLGTPTPTVAMVVPIFRSDRSVSGVVFVGLNPNDPQFLSLLQIDAASFTQLVEIVDSAGVVLNATDPKMRWHVDDHGGQFSALITNNQAVVGTCHHCHNADGIVAPKENDVMAFAPLSSATWGVTLRQSRAETFAMNEILRSRLILLGTIAILVMGIITWQFLVRIIRPVKTLTRACQTIANGNLDIQIKNGYPGEIGQLAVAFEIMRDRLHESIKETQSWAIELEARIATRTQDLLESREQLLLANRRLSALNHISESLRKSVNLGEILTISLEEIVNLTNAQRGVLLLNDPETKRFEVAARLTSDPHMPYVCKWPIVLQTAENITNHSTKDIVELQLADQSSFNHDGEHCRSEYRVTFVPMVGQESIPGVILLVNNALSHLSQTEIDLLKSIGVAVGTAVENALLFKELIRKEESLSRMLQKIIQAQEEERRRIARELHDETSQTITALNLGLKTAIMAPADSPEIVKERLTPLQGIADGILREINRMIQDLRPSLLDDLGLRTAIDWYAKNRLSSKGIQVKWRVSGAERRLPTELETAIFRVAQEALSNIARHANATEVIIDLNYREEQIELTIQDNGIGFDVAQTVQREFSESAYGLMGMRERVELLGGTLAIESHPDDGTKISIYIPVESMDYIEKWTQYAY